MQQQASAIFPGGARTGTGRARRVMGVLWAVLLGACADSSEAPAVAQNRGSEPDAGASASPDASAQVKVSNVGDPCSLLLPACRGDRAECLEISLSGAFYTGGYCTADCRSSAECGPGAECPVAESELLDPDYDFRSTWARKCFKSCVPEQPNACRFGYACMSLADAYDAPDAPAPLHHNVCIPRAPTFSWDAGSSAADRLHDAGSH
ncbi:MAG: hypothetical protein JWN04_4705 [Myxococcaceae bacterium]|nr:hypothetical protein [Myxococcaceae bacterium]